MLRAMSRLLSRAMILELLRTGALTTGVLVVVVSFGAAIKPLSEDALFSAGQITRYIVLATVPMLQFALPFAAGFAGTMVMHRMAVDNEVVAANACGIGHHRLLVPVLAVGLGLTVAMVALTQSVIPRFWAMLEQTIARDIAVLFERSLGRGDPFQLGDLQIWADTLVADPDQAPAEADTRLFLTRVAVADLDEEGRIVTDVTAEQVAIDIYRRADETVLAIAMRDAVAYRPGDGMLAWIERPERTTIRIPTDLRDSPKRMTRGELKALQRDPDPLPRVDRRRRAMIEALREAAVARGIGERLARRGAIELVGRGFGGGGADATTWSLEGSGIDARGRVRPGADGRITVVQSEDGRPRRRFVARRAELVRDRGAGLERVAGGLTVGRTVEPTDELRFVLRLKDVEWTDLDAPDSTTTRAEVPLDGLRVADIAPPDLADLDSAALLARADDLERRLAGEGAELPPTIARAREDLARERTDVLEEVEARLLSRYATSGTAILLLLLGAVLAMGRRHSSPLAVYLWAFLPSVVDLILISSGEHMMRDGNRLPGLAVMWSGNLALLLLTLVAFRRLARN